MTSLELVTLHGPRPELPIVTVAGERHYETINEVVYSETVLRDVTPRLIGLEIYQIGDGSSHSGPYQWLIGRVLETWWDSDRLSICGLANINGLNFIPHNPFERGGLVGLSWLADVSYRALPGDTRRYVTKVNNVDRIEVVKYPSTGARFGLLDIRR